MSKCKYNFRVTDIDKLEAFSPKSVVTEKRAIRGMITKMLDCGIDLSEYGVEIQGDDAEKENTIIPEFIKKKGAVAA